MIDKELAEVLKEVLSNASQISLIIHKNPDVDALGSALGLKFFLENHKPGIKVFVISPNEIPEYIDWLEGLEQIIVHTHSPDRSTDALMHSDIVFCLDFNAVNRIDNVADVLQVLNSFRVLIDHHPEPEVHPDLLFSYPEASSTAELVWEIINFIDKNAVDKRVADCIMAGIIGDTGCFCYNSVRPNTFKVAYELLLYNADRIKIVNGLYNNFSYDRTRLLGYMLYEKLKFIPEKKTAYMSLTLEEKQRFNYKKGDHEDFVNMPLSIKDVIFSALFVENEDNIRVSLRSKGNFDVNTIARKYFRGGGHKNAAGGNFSGTMQELVDFFENVVLKELQVEG